MFGLFRKKAKAQTVLDKFVTTVYGASPPPVDRADLSIAIKLAHEELLTEVIDIKLVETVASELHDFSIPYSTHDLAISTALNIFRKGENKELLRSSQIVARLKALEWYNNGDVNAVILSAFENSLYKEYSK